MNIKIKYFNWLAFVISFVLFIFLTQSVGKVFFINTTSSMPTGIYIKDIFNTDFEVGDKIVFKIHSKKKN